MSPRPPGLYWVDGHQDLACHCQECQRDIVDPGLARCMITLPWLMQTGVRLVFATFFVPHTLPHELRQVRLQQQYEMYQSWLQRYPEALRLITSAADLAALAEAGPVEIPGAALWPAAAGEAGELGYPLGLFFLMEGCDLLESPTDLELWYGRGLRLASLTWNGTNRYASGCFSDNAGLTALGFELIAEMEQLGMLLDLSHLADQGVEDVFARFRGRLCATHSNSRTIAEHQRNLTDAQALEIAQRGGVIGLNLLATFIRGGWHGGMPLPSIDEALAHVEYFAGLCGPRHVALGSDLDGGLTPENTPEGIDSIRDLQVLADNLAGRGWDAAQLQGFAGANWWDLLERSLPL
jgi:microsomal dipeptidase-like Zn-dependent dipeptidase